MSESIIRLNIPCQSEQLCALRAGDRVLLSGKLYTGRDAAHKRLYEAIEKGDPLPVNLRGQFIYYVGPAPAKPPAAAGSAGPTTATRVDAYTPRLLDLGLKGMIGKGLRSASVIESMKKNGAVYFGAVGGAAALISKSIKSVSVVCYEDLGTEAIYQFTVEDFPVIVLIDTLGNNLYETEPAKYRRI